MKNQGIIIKNTKKVKLSNTSVTGNKIETIAQPKTQTEEIENINQGYLIEEVESLAVSEAKAESNLITETKKRKRKISQEELHQDEEVIAMEIDEQFSLKASSSQIQQTQTENNYLLNQLNKVEELTSQKTQAKNELTSQQALDAYWDNLRNKSLAKKEEQEQTPQIIHNPPKNS